MPTPQLTQDELEVEGWYVPDGQAVHTLAAVFEYFPAEQVDDAVVRPEEGQKRPAEQVVHVLAEAADW